MSGVGMASISKFRKDIMIHSVIGEDRSKWLLG